MENKYFRGGKKLLIAVYSKPQQVVCNSSQGYALERHLGKKKQLFIVKQERYCAQSN
jgi:hypothetical protein